MYDLIRKKRDGKILAKDEIIYIIDGYTKDKIPDYQMSALLMAVYLKGMNEEETLNLTIAMADSGDKLDLSEIKGVKVDKHSTGGVGDKTSLILGPMVAACGVPVAKMSGRGLGHTGGTIDKLESFKGFTTSLSEKDFINNVNDIKLAIVGQTANLAPADKKIYALRDVTGTVENISLIASSIMSKKIASGADAIVLDVKTGDGAFMKTEEEAVKLAEEMVKIGNGAGRKTVALITDMDQPLGYAVGNALEVKEAIDTLNGKGSKELLELCYALGSQMLVLGGKALSESEARIKLQEAVKSKSALSKMAEFIKAQGGEMQAVYQTDLLPKAEIIEPVLAQTDGYISKIKCEEVGMVSLILGGGRENKESIIDLSVGVILCKKIGDKVKNGDILAYIHGNAHKKVNEAKERLLSAYTITKETTGVSKLVKQIVR